MSGFIKDVGLLYKEAWSVRTDIKEDLRSSRDLEDRWTNRIFLFTWWVMFLIAHFVLIAVPSAIVFTIAGLMGAYG